MVLMCELCVCGKMTNRSGRIAFRSTLKGEAVAGRSCREKS